MDAITQLLAVPLGALTALCYELLHNYCLAILLFTLLTRVILLPVNIWVQKNSIKVVELQPAINRIKARFFGDHDRINEETAALYKAKKYRPAASVIPLVIQLVLLMGVIAVVREPETAGMTASDMICWGIDFYRIPREAGGWYLLWPLIAAAAALALCLAENADQVLQAEASKLNKYGMLALSVGLSLYLGLFVRAGVALYWTAGNLLAIGQIYLLNWWIDPRKYIDYDELEQSRKELAAMESLGAGDSREAKRRERADYKRFFSVTNKHLVFYSEGSGFYKYYQGVIEWLLAHSNVIIHYITSDCGDQIFALAEKQPRIKPYYIGQKRLITLFMRMDADLVVMTTPDLENYFLKRSYIRKDIEYIYIDHGLGSDNMLLREGALDHFDTVFCCGEHIVREIEAMDALRGIEPPQKTVPVGFPYLDALTAMYEAMPKTQKAKKQILIAPSHQPDNILESCIDGMLEALLPLGCRIVVRPHPQALRRTPAVIESLLSKWGGYPADTLEIQTDFSSNDTVYESDLLITDWSGIAYEFSFATCRPSLFINTTMKVINPHWKAIDVEPVDFRLRRGLGAELEPDELDRLAPTAEELLGKPDKYSEQIAKLKEETLYNLGRSARAAGKYILAEIRGKNEEKKESEP